MKNEREEISAEKAFEDHKINTFHTKEKDYELRFRLIKGGEETSYIRTESLKDHWQEAHLHRQLQETYIVQRGWIGYAEKHGMGRSLKKYGAGEIFTVPSNMVHNIFMPKDSVIHTVKHGEGKEEVRSTDMRFTKKTQNITKEEFLILIKKNSLSISQESFNEGYRHFDNLIWQVLAWSTGIFSAILIGTLNIKEPEIKTLLEMADSDLSSLLSFIYFLGFLFLLALSYTLHRFRFNQIETSIQVNKLWRRLKSPQNFLQLIVNIQLSIFLYLFLSSFEINPIFRLLVMIAVIIMTTTWQIATIIRKQNDKAKKTMYNQ
jgi:hypothetical protein